MGRTKIMMGQKWKRKLKESKINKSLKPGKYPSGFEGKSPQKWVKQFSVFFNVVKKSMLSSRTSNNYGAEKGVNRLEFKNSEFHCLKGGGWTPRVKPKKWVDNFWVCLGWWRPIKNCWASRVALNLGVSQQPLHCSPLAKRNIEKGRQMTEGRNDKKQINFWNELMNYLHSFWNNNVATVFKGHTRLWWVLGLKVENWGKSLFLTRIYPRICFMWGKYLEELKLY